MIHISGRSDIGKISTNNEDVFLAETIWDDNHFLAVVIDGVGGQEGGEVAAAIAKERIKNYLLTYKDGERERLLKEAVTDANNAIFKDRLEKPSVANMSCVLTACIADRLKRKLYMCHVGDTRLYRFAQNQLMKLSHDHSLVGYREEKGDLTEEEAMNHPQRNIINRDLGSLLHKTDDEDFIETGSFDIPSGIIFLLCSDGLSDMITSEQIKTILESGNTTEVKVTDLIVAANDAGGKDNITVVLIDFSHEPLSPDFKDAETIDTRYLAATGALEPMLVDHNTLTTARESEPVNPVAAQVSPSRDPNIQVTPIPAHKPPGYPSLRIAIWPWLLLGFLLGIAIKPIANFFLPGEQKTIPGIPTVQQSARELPVESIYQQLETAQKQDSDSFSLPAGDTIFLTRPLVISKNTFTWIQKDTIFVKPEDSVQCPVALLITGNNCSLNLVNIKFLSLKKALIDLGNNNSIKATNTLQPARP